MVLIGCYVLDIKSGEVHKMHKRDYISYPDIVEVDGMMYMCINRLLYRLDDNFIKCSDVLFSVANSYMVGLKLGPARGIVAMDNGGMNIIQSMPNGSMVVFNYTRNIPLNIHTMCSEGDAIYFIDQVDRDFQIRRMK